MRNCMLRSINWLLFLSLLTIFSCDDDILVFEGILLRDPYNQDMGTRGSRDLDDWENDGKLTKEVLKLLDFESDVSITGTEVSTSVQIYGFPNPVKDRFTMGFNLSHKSLVKLVVVNQRMNVLHSLSFAEQGLSYWDIDVRDARKFPSGKIVRIYYSISAENNPDFYVGHGDVLVCRNTTCF